MDIVSDYVTELAEHYAKQVDELIRYKIKKLAYMAYAQGELKLYRILLNIDESNIEDTRVELFKDGYTLELEYPKYLITDDEKTTNATIRVGEIKLLVRKIILEV